MCESGGTAILSAWRVEKEASRRDCGGGDVGELHLEIGLKKAIEWISHRRQDEPKVGLAVLVDEACRRFDLTPIQAEFLLRHFTQA